MYIYSNTEAGKLYVESDKKYDSFCVTDSDGREVPCKITAEAFRDGKNVYTLDAENLSVWEPDTPVLYTLRADDDEERFGYVTLKTVQNKMVTVNGTPFFFRGYIRGITAHDHPNMTGGSETECAEKNIRQAKKYGFNLVRFHSAQPTDEFLDAADRLGLFIQLEFTFQYEFDENGNKKGLSVNNTAWTEALYKYRNHPSVAIFCIGNEMHNSGHYPAVKVMYNEGKRLAPNKLIMDNSGWGEYDRDTADIFSQHIAYFFPYKHHGNMFMTDDPWMMNGSVSDEPLNMETGEGETYVGAHRYAVPIRPVIAHETVHYIDVPDYEALNKKYDAFAERVGKEYLDKNGIKKPKFLTEIPALIRRKGLAEIMPEYIKASRYARLQAMKIYFEKLRLSSLCGFEMLQLSDCLKYENKNGIIDCFDDDNGIDPAWMKTLNDDAVLLCEFPDEVFFENDVLTAEISCSDFMKKAEQRGTLRVTFDDSVLFEGKSYVLCGGVQKLLSLRWKVKKTGKAACHTLKAEFTLEDKVIRNEWHVWTYPEAACADFPDGTVFTDVFDEKVFEALSEGKTVILNYKYFGEGNKWNLPGAMERFKPCIWDRGSNLGGINFEKVLSEKLAFGRYFDLNMQPILEAGSKVNLDHFPFAVKEFTRGIDKPVRDRMQGLLSGDKSYVDDKMLRKFTHLWSLRVGNGLLIVCCFNLSKTSNPVTANLLSALKEDISVFDTDYSVPEEEFRAYLEEVNAKPFPKEDVMNYFWEIDNKPVEDVLFWEEAGISLADIT